MKTFTLLLIAAAMVVAKSAAIRGSSMQLESQDGEKSRGRHLMQESTCKLYQKCATYLPTEDFPEGHHEETWVCELSQEDSTRMGVQFVDVVESPAIAAAIESATSGESTLTVTEAFVDTDSPRMYIPENAHISLGNATTVETRMQKRRRSLTSTGPSTTGVLKALVIRVIDKKNLQPTISVKKLVDDVFEDNVSLSSQTDACSYGKLKIEPFKGNTPSGKQIDNGVVNVKMNYDSNDGSALDQAAMRAATDQLGDLNDPMFDLVMFCFPPGSPFVAFAYPNSKYSFYNDQWCGYVSAQMHEIGHNLGLGHSGEVGADVYGDTTGMMGSAAGVDDTSRCYNAQKSYQLGWYDDKTDTIDPLDGAGSYNLILNGISDYKKRSDALIALRLEQTSLEQDYYVGFNRATGINKDSGEDRNMVTITRKEFGAPDKYGQSSKIAGLNPGDRFVIENFNNDRDVQIVFVGLENGDAKILVIDGSELPQASTRCQKFTIELTTDSVPSDSFWYITNDKHEVTALSPVYNRGNRKYQQEVCLPMIDYPKPFKLFTRGRGSYKTYNDKNQEIFSGGKDSFVFLVPKDPNPPVPSPAPSQAPSAKPTPAPPCQPHTVEVKTDEFPEDNSWKIIFKNEFQEEIVVATSPVFDKKAELYKTKVCLAVGKSYEFRFADSHGDGICCGYGAGYYRVVEDCSQKVVLMSASTDDSFSEEIKIIDTISECRASVTTPGPSPAVPNTIQQQQQQQHNPTPQQHEQEEQEQCTDRKKKRWRIKGEHKGRRRSCKNLAKKGKCDTETSTGEFVWQFCQKSCNRCGD